MLLNPTTFILASAAQRDLLDSARLDGRTTEPTASERDTRTPARRSRRFRFARARLAL